MQRTVLYALAALALVVGTEVRAADDKGAWADDVRRDFKKFAAAVRADKPGEAAKWIAPPADKHWEAYAALLPAVAKYDAALVEKFGKGMKSPFAEIVAPGRLADHFYEVGGEIAEVKAAGKDRAHVRVWTKRPDWRKKSEDAIYERRFTAVKIGGVWKFHLHSIAGGTPVLKKVKRTRDGKEIEVYAEHTSKGGIDERDWVELDPIDHGGRTGPSEELALFTTMRELVAAQTEQVLKGTYATQKVAVKALEDALDKAHRPKK